MHLMVYHVLKDYFNPQILCHVWKFQIWSIYIYHFYNVFFNHYVHRMTKRLSKNSLARVIIEIPQSILQYLSRYISTYMWTGRKRGFFFSFLKWYVEDIKSFLKKSMDQYFVTCTLIKYLKIIFCQYSTPIS